MASEKELLQRIADHLDSARYESAALQAICSMLLAEVALASADPAAKLTQVSGSLRKLADRLNTETGTTSFSTTIGLVVKGAQAGVRSARRSASR